LPQGTKDRNAASASARLANSFRDPVDRPKGNVEESADGITGNARDVHVPIQIARGSEQRVQPVESMNVASQWSISTLAPCSIESSPFRTAGAVQRSTSPEQAAKQR
jgi:hypothetical protein